MTACFFTFILYLDKAEEESPMKRRIIALTVIMVMIALTFGAGACFAASSSTKTVYVISSMTVKNSSSNSEETIKFKYNDNGLLKSYKGNDYHKGTFKYSGTKLKYL